MYKLFSTSYPHAACGNGGGEENGNGFTIFELLVAISIFVIVTAVMLANFRGADRMNELMLSADLSASYIREAQNKAVSGITEGGSIVNGYGVSMVNGQTFFTTYADPVGGNNRYTAGEEITSVNLNKNVSITGATVDIFFRTPDGMVYEGGALASNVITLKLTHSVIGKSIDVDILPVSGQVTVGKPY